MALPLAQGLAAALGDRCSHIGNLLLSVHVPSGSQTCLSILLACDTALYPLQSGEHGVGSSTIPASGMSVDAQGVHGGQGAVDASGVRSS